MKKTKERRTTFQLKSNKKKNEMRREKHIRRTDYAMIFGIRSRSIIQFSTTTSHTAKTRKVLCRRRSRKKQTLQHSLHTDTGFTCFFFLLRLFIHFIIYYSIFVISVEMREMCIYAGE